jgi:hypothetical protein
MVQAFGPVSNNLTQTLKREDIVIEDHVGHS